MEIGIYLMAVFMFLGGYVGSVLASLQPAHCLLAHACCSSQLLLGPACRLASECEIHVRVDRGVQLLTGTRSIQSRES